MLTTRTWTLLIATAVLVAAGAFNLSQRINRIPPPTDGVEWTLNADGNVVATQVLRDYSGARAGIVPGDRLLGVSLTGRSGTYEELVRPEDTEVYLEQAGAGGQLHYLIERPTNPEEMRFYEADLYGLEPISSWTRREIYLHFVGLVFLLVGLFVLFKQGGRAPFVMHFAVLCVAAFVFLVYKPIGIYEDFDLAVAFLDDAGLILFAALFLHFCAIYPVRRRLSEKTRLYAAAIYLPAIILLGLTAFAYFGSYFSFAVSREFIETLYAANLQHFLIALVAGAGILVYRFARSRSIVVRQQLKWVVWGSVLAIAPFALLYAIGLLIQFSGGNSSSGSIENRLTDAAVLPLVLIPLTFGNSVVRYRLMDVDVVVRRAVVYALTTLAISLMIGAVVLSVGYYALGMFDERTNTPSFASLPVLFAIVAMAVIVMTAAPLKNFLQERTNRLFYGERYDLRNGLLDFGRTLSATTALDPLLDALTSRIQQVLGVERIAIFIEDVREASGYRVARAVGLSNTILVPPDFRDMIRTRSAETGIVRADDLDLSPEATGFVRRALHYYVPCVARGRMVAVIGLGRSAEGALLSSEDLEILRTVSGYIAVAVENSLLYQEQQERAAEVERLKEFNESIVESVNVGLLAVDAQGRAIRCNSALEAILGVRREEITGCHVEELFGEDFAPTLEHILGEEGWRLNELRSLYQIHTATRQGRPLVLNIALAPLQNSGFSTQEHNQGGALIVLEDTTERTRLEEQLQQREKLSSIGLLAAGVAHEINTPLTGVSSYTQMLLGMISEQDPKNALLQKIRRQTERAAGIVNNLLNFSRMGAGGEFTPVDINRVLEDTLQLLEPQLRQSRIETVREYEENLPPVYGNAGKLQQVFTNLILNARDAILDNGRITLRTAMENDSVCIEVRDTGIGIAPEAMSKIYDPFFTTKGVGRGTGLGLAVSYGIVQEHQGRIAAESAPGEGTKFRIILPVYQESARRLQAAGD
jgi:two-component system, NtrC family, sensor kinase